jgi:S1-C subfamily serine protease
LQASNSTSGIKTGAIGIVNWEACIPCGADAAANIEAGDVVTAINGSPLGNWSDFIPTISAMAPGTDVYLTTYRDEQLIEVKVTIGSFECPRH